MENIIVYGFGGILSKLIPLLMVPIVTRLMPDSSYYGISDLSNTLVQFGSYLAVMGMYDAMYRMFFEKDDDNYKKDICSTALIFTVGTSIVGSVLMVVFREYIAKYVFGSSEYGYLVYLTAVATLSGATNCIVSAPTRMQNKRKVYLVMNSLIPLLSYSIAIPLLMRGHYVIALPLSAAISAVISEMLFYILNHRWFSVKRFHKEYLKPLLQIAIPLLPNFLIYWIFNSCDKLMIVNMIGTAASGVYSVGSKLGHASQLIYTAFAGGWQYFAFSTMKEEGQVKLNSRVFEYLGVISFACAVFAFALCKPIYQCLFEGEYVSGYIVAPYLFLAPLLQMLFQVAANQFLVVKKTWPNLFILSSGAVVNIIINLWLISVIGIEGAAMATLVGYVVSDVICVIVLCKMKLMVVDARFIVSAVIMTAYIIIWRAFFHENPVIGTVIAVIVVLAFCFLYKRDLFKAVEMIKKWKKDA